METARKAERQPDYLEETSPAVQGAQYFIIPPPGLLQVKGSDVLDLLAALPRRPRSLLLFKKHDETTRLAEEKAAAARLETVQKLMRHRQLDDARIAALKQQQRELLLGATSTAGRRGGDGSTTMTTATTRRAGHTADDSFDNQSGGVPPAFAHVISPVTIDARAFLSAREVETSAGHLTMASPAAKKTQGLIDSARERAARGEVIAPPKELKRSKLALARRPGRKIQDSLTPLETEDGGDGEGQRPPSFSGNTPRERRGSMEESSEARFKREQQAVVAKLLKFFVAQRFVQICAQQKQYEETADEFRGNERFMELITRAQRGIRRRCRQLFLFKLWVSKARIFAAVSRFKRLLTVKRRNRHIVQVRRFLIDANTQCYRTIRLKYYSRCVIKAQRFARSFIVCLRCRTRLLMLRLTKTLKSLKYENSAQREQFHHGLEILKSPFGRALVWSLVAKIRKTFISTRQDYQRRVREGDNTPAFTEVDVWHVREYLVADAAAAAAGHEQEEDREGMQGGEKGSDSLLPLQYRHGANTTGPPIFKLFSRQYLDQELVELVKISLGYKISPSEWDHMLTKRRAGKKSGDAAKKKKTVRLAPPAVAQVVKAKRKVNKDKETGEVIGADKEAMALIKVLQGRLREWKRDVVATERLHGSPSRPGLAVPAALLSEAVEEEEEEEEVDGVEGPVPETVPETVGLL